MVVGKNKGLNKPGKKGGKKKMYETSATKTRLKEVTS